MERDTARLFVERIQEVQYAPEEGQMLAEGPALERLIDALIRANEVWSITDHSSTIFEWGKGEMDNSTPQRLAEAANILAEVGIETYINGQWLNISLTDPEDGLFVDAPDEEDEDEEVETEAVVG